MSNIRLRAHKKRNFWLIPNDWIASCKVRNALEKISVLILDFEGASVPTEVVMQISFLETLRHLGVTEKEYGNIYRIEKETSGKAIDVILDNFKRKYSEIIPGSVTIEEMEAIRKQKYLDIVEKYNLMTFPYIKNTIGLSEREDVETIFLSNGAHDALYKILTKDGICENPDWKSLNHTFGKNETWRDAEKSKYEICVRNSAGRVYYHHLMASDSATRLKAAKELGLTETEAKDKALVLAAFSEKFDIPPNKILVIEDNPKTLQKMGEALKKVWGKKFKPLKAIYVVHEFNHEKEMPSPELCETIAILQGPAPISLCKNYGITQTPELAALANEIYGEPMQTASQPKAGIPNIIFKSPK